MKIAVTYDNGNIFQHFGHSEYFKIYIVEDNKVVSSEVVPTNGAGHSALSGFLVENKINVLICGGIGTGAQRSISFRGIKLHAGVTGDCDLAVSKLLDGTLVSSNEANCSCTGHDHDHDDHNCGSGCH